jgi:hypothetical protein
MTVMVMVTVTVMEGVSGLQISREVHAATQIANSASTSGAGSGSEDTGWST